jgi:hypothetical protein
MQWDIEIMKNVRKETITARMKAGFLKRLNEAMDLAGAPPEDPTRRTPGKWRYGRNAWLQKRLGKKNVGRILRGQGMFKFQELPEIAEKLGVRFDWLVTGLGPKTNTKKMLGGLANRDLMRRIRAAVDTLPIMTPETRKKIIRYLYEELSA